MTAPSRVGLPADGLRAGRDRPEVRSRKRIPTRAKSPPRAHVSPRISLKCKAPTRERARQGDKCASFETEFRESPSPSPEGAKTCKSEA